MAELGQTEDPTALVPGSIGEIEAIIAMCRRRADVAGDAADTVGRKKSIDDWAGTAADAYAEKVARLTRAWTDAQDALSRVAVAMRAYRSALAQAQQRAAIAVTVWEYGEALQRQEQAGPPAAPFTQRLTPSPHVFSAGTDRVAPRTSDEAFAKATGWLSEARGWVSDAARIAVAEVNAATELLHVADGSMWATAGAALATAPVTSATALSVLKSMKGPDLASLLAARPDLVGLVSRTTPADVAAWWPGLDNEQQDALIHAIPAVIGNLGGVAYRARDEANRIVLEQAIHDARRHASESPDQLAALEALERSASGYTLTSLVLDVPPLAQVAVGNLDAATNVSFIVPGMNSNVEGDMLSYVNASQKLQQAQQKFGGGDLGDYAVVAWLGYHPPMNSNPADVAFNGKAEAGASALARDLTSMAAVHAATGSPAAVSVVAHSYGTNVTALALTEAHADHVVLLGSAGVDSQVDNAAAMNVPPGQVFASQADHDGWAPIGQFTSRVVGDGRVDPTQASFGAHEFSSEAATTPSGEVLRAVDKHGPFGDGSTTFSYLDPNTTAQYNTALATVDRGDDVIAR
ncbi:alpha/beta hydrolase [Microbacterium testaceum]|uniref:alpha/beta hydrolase n=1 Tax=Microbacterium testaceum TaxID=2033 RepID=UPI002AC3E2D7|nr:alpha/beta hydrolase [Microbacterium testaceum]MDZ5143998.1 alpha/beta hydrolase family protein [Microbacterium testaceum]